MLDINSWSVYAGEHAEYAIGGPSIELLFKSYNEKYQTNYMAEAKNVSGYRIGVGDSNSESFQLIIVRDTTYVITDITNAYGMWIASPSATTSSNLLFMNRDGRVMSTEYYTSTLGFRPVVCLKSDVRLEKNEDGIYTIVGTVN